MSNCFLETGALALWDGEFNRLVEACLRVKADWMPRRHLHLSRESSPRSDLKIPCRTNIPLNRTQQGIYYEVTGTEPSRQVTFEFYLSHIADATQYYQ